MINSFSSCIARAIPTDTSMSGRHDKTRALPTFYATAVSLYCAKVRIMLRHKRIPWQEKQPTGGYGSSEWRHQVPAGNLPALEHDGLILTDSEVIAEYLEEIWPEISMQAETPALRALVRQRSRFHDTRLEPALRGLFGWLSTGSISNDASSTDTVGQRFDRIQQRLDQLGQLLDLEKQQLNTARLWLGDCGFAASFPWIQIIEQKADRIFIWPDTVLDYRHQLETFPAVIDEYDGYKQAIANWMDAK
ncbi:MAG: glutathione S-transferase [Alphaproteobacteria bacterium]|nr:glutathione S-transferase [Alphaproteobacteria bacterium]